MSQRLPYAVHLSGAPRVALLAASDVPAQVVVEVYDVAPDGEARVVTRGVHAFVDGKASFALYPQDWRFEPGHRIAVAVQGNDSYWSNPQLLGGGLGAGDVAVSGASLAVPALRYDRRSFLYAAQRDDEPELTLTAETIRASETSFRLPPRLRSR